MIMDKTPVEEFKDRGQKSRAIIDQLFQVNAITHSEYLLLRETIDTFEGELLKIHGVATTTPEWDISIRKAPSEKMTVLYTNGIKYTWGEGL